MDGRVTWNPKEKLRFPQTKFLYKLGLVPCESVEEHVWVHSEQFQGFSKQVSWLFPFIKGHVEDGALTQHVAAKCLLSTTTNPTRKQQQSAG